MKKLQTLLFLIISISFNVFADEIQIGPAKLSGNLIQGGIMFGETDPSNTVELDGKKVRLTPDGKFVLGFGRDASPTSTITITNANGDTAKQTLPIKQRKYNIQKVEGVPKRTVSPSKESLARIKEETALIKQARATNSDKEYFLNSFQWPLIGPLTGFYGSQRYYNGVPKRPHYGLDIAAPKGTLVYAPTDAVVTLAHQDMFYSGGTLIMDHGYGVSSTFIHLSEVLVKVGDEVKQGDPVGRVGAGGRATGPHLDWRINWFGVRLDPQLILPEMPKSPN